MNEKNIQQVLEIENQAREIHDAAVREAEQMPILAEGEAQSMITSARAGAQAEARKLLEKAQSQDESARILGEAEEKSRQLEALAMTNFDRAVNFVLERIVGGE